EGLHIIHSYARGHTTEKGPYEEEFLYEIQVSDSNLRSREPQRGALSITVTNLLLAEFNKRHKERELTDEEHVKLTQIIKQSRERNDKTVLNVVQVLKKLREIKPEKYDEFKSKITEFSDQKP
ncbi:MAG TPA: hypothetical protein VI278_18485, partial [Nitrososphaeraceae archaeon]